MGRVVSSPGIQRVVYTTGVVKQERRATRTLERPVISLTMELAPPSPLRLPVLLGCKGPVVGAAVFEQGVRVSEPVACTARGMHSTWNIQHT